ncbi:S24 family peptidase [Leptolyngbya sp. CCNP1308]|uniref:S24 family peptidase n=1 Tax=Leptolyngbya sp. CCNP1308 TaxID=3110255 RepID=UPI002B21A77C|nr:S24 family peptidase [Leptolyngbya sp. CCNP1308]MEA5449695.1 S24 family peptidase [Leptolyngbya sp. CCNP1308]
MSFPVPGDAIEQSLDLNQHLIHNPAATFFMRVEGDMVADQEVQPGDLLVVDRSQTAQDSSLVVAAIAGSLQVLKVQQHHGKLVPASDRQPGEALDMEIWGVVTTLIRKV